ncbi:MAG: hypothetical protein HRU03_00930 [Nanoarchaeales archaeon]|nr:hypothetical protein [Nanoarchaeales archaeon]
MDKSIAQNYYKRIEIQKAILNFAKDREIGVMFDGYFGKRPDVIEYLTDVKQLVDKGIFSFHCSEERWANALLLGTEKKQEDRDNNRVGWDLILDLDGVDYVYSRLLGKVIIDFFDDIGVKNVTTKFSGNKGFHIGVPFEAFSRDCYGLVEGINESRLLFPDVAKRTVVFMLEHSEFNKNICKAILEYNGGDGGIGEINKISNKYNIPLEDLKYDEKTKLFDFMKVIDIDTILITSRHLFRMPYSLNEKSGLVSVPLPNDKIMTFEREDALPEKVNPEDCKDFEFLTYNPKFGKDGNKLLVKVYEDLDGNINYDDIVKEHQKKKKDRLGIMQSEGGSIIEFEINQEVTIADFPKTITHILKTDFLDGRKRALFVLITFLTSIKWDWTTIDKMIEDWNNKQTDSLKKQYIGAQVSWFKVKEKPISPPNFISANFYSSIGIPEDVINDDKRKFSGTTIKNPLHFVFVKLKRDEMKKELEKKNKKKEPKKKPEPKKKTETKKKVEEKEQTPKQAEPKELKKMN